MKKYIIIITASIVLFSGCKKFLDVNRDPDALYEAPLELILPAALSSPMYILGGDGQIFGAYWAQHWTQATNAPQFQDFDSWQITNTTFDGRGYGSLYYYALADLKYIKNEARATVNWSYYLIATVIESYVYQTLVDLYDQVPYTEAIQGESGNITPKFDDGQYIYNCLADSINFALTMPYTGGTSADPGDADIIFNGDMTKWAQFANTLLLKIYLRQSKVNSTTIGEKINTLKGRAFLTEDACYNIFVNQADKQNPIYASAEVKHKGNISMSRTLMGYLIDDMFGAPVIRDSRVDYLAHRPEKVQEYHRALLQGDYYANSNVYYLGGSSTPNYWGAEGIEYLSRPHVEYNHPLYYMTAAESYFLQAEADLLYWQEGNAQALYESGVTEAFKRLKNIGVVPVEDTDYSEEDVIGTTGYAPWNETDTEEEKLEKIWIQKWISMTNIQGIEAFIEHNRTNCPQEHPINPKTDPLGWDDDYERGWFTVSVNNVTSDVFPRRLMVPQSELDGNPNVPSDMRNKKITDPVWWDVD
jgi:hypothetical protein